MFVVFIIQHSISPEIFHFLFTTPSNFLTTSWWVCPVKHYPAVASVAFRLCSSPQDAPPLLHEGSSVLHLIPSPHFSKSTAACLLAPPPPITFLSPAATNPSNQKGLSQCPPSLLIRWQDILKRVFWLLGLLSLWF